MEDFPAARAALIAVVGLCAIARAAEIMPAAQQNAVMGKYCAGCHSDALMYGGLSVQHFDAAYPEPSVAAMLVSKLTAGHSPSEVEAAAGPDSAATILGFMKTGAMGAAGNGVPDETTQVEFVRALTAEAAGAEEWHSHRDEKTPAQSGVLTATLLRQIPSTKFAGKIDMYHLILSCRTDTRAGEIKLAWANGVPDEGQPIEVVVDGKDRFTHKVEGGKKQGNGANGPGATILYPSAEMNMPFPAQSLSISNLFPDETIVFPFENLGQTVRRDLSTCFTQP